MKLKVISTEQHPSAYGGEFFYVFFKDVDNGKSYRTCVATNYRNFHNWDDVFAGLKAGLDVYVDNVRLKGNGLIDADSKPAVITNKKGGELC